MKPTRWFTLFAIMAAAILFAFLIDRTVAAFGAIPFQVNWFFPALPLIIALVVIIAGRAVKALRSREETWITPLGAARVAIFSQAASRVGAGLTGFAAGHALYAWMSGNVPLWREQLWQSAAAALGWLVLTVCAVMVERWCTIESSDDDDDDGTSTGPTGPAGAVV